MGRVLKSRIISYIWLVKKGQGLLVWMEPRLGIIFNLGLTEGRKSSWFSF